MAIAADMGRQRGSGNSPSLSVAIGENAEMKYSSGLQRDWGQSTVGMISMAEHGLVDRWSSRAANAIAIWPVLVPSGMAGILVGYLASGARAISQYGAFGWVSAGLVGFLLIAVALLSVASVREKWIIASWATKKSKVPDSVNPLDSEFRSSRIKILDLVHPITNKVVRKRFIGCQLMGPANIGLRGHVLFKDSGFLNCDVVIIRENAPIFNAIILEDCEVLSSEVMFCTLFVPQDVFDNTMKGLNAVPLTYSRPA